MTTGTSAAKALTVSLPITHPAVGDKFNPVSRAGRGTKTFSGTSNITAASGRTLQRHN